MPIPHTILTHPLYLLFETTIFVLLPSYLSYRLSLLSRLRWLIGILQISYLIYIHQSLELPFPSLAQPLILDLRLFALLLYTICCSLVIIVLAQKIPRVLYLPHPMIYPQYSLPSILALYVLLSAPLQELFFRGYYLARLSISLPTTLAIILSSLVFAIFHLQFKNKFLVVGSFLSGLVWSIIYLQTQNLLLISISHAILGLTFSYLAHIITRRFNA